MRAKAWTWSLLSGIGLTGLMLMPTAVTAAQADRCNGCVAVPGEESGRTATDELLARYLRSKLADQVPDSAGVNVDVTDGVVALSGTVGSRAAERRMLSLVRRTIGVAQVDDQLVVQPSRDARSDGQGR